ncbi:MAG: hypothetical protein ABIL58_14875 [Pseudomonadota bacterium]
MQFHFQKTNLNGYDASPIPIHGAGRCLIEMISREPLPCFRCISGTATSSGDFSIIISNPTCLIFGYTFIRLRFVLAAASGSLITAAYIATTLWVIRPPTEILWIQFPFVVGVNLLGMFVAFHIEYSARRAFYLRELLMAQKTVVDAANEQLERRVAERTEALEAANKTLQRHIDALKQSELERHKLAAHRHHACRPDARRPGRPSHRN